MTEHHVHHLVITEKGALVGMVSALDIVRAQCGTTAPVDDLRLGHAGGRGRASSS